MIDLRNGILDPNFLRQFLKMRGHTFKKNYCFYYFVFISIYLYFYLLNESLVLKIDAVAQAGMVTPAFLLDDCAFACCSNGIYVCVSLLFVMLLSFSFLFFIDINIIIVMIVIIVIVIIVIIDIIVIIVIIVLLLLLLLLLLL